MSPVLRAMMMKKIVDADDERRKDMSPEERKKSNEKFENFAAVAAVLMLVGITVMVTLLIYVR